MSDTNLKSHLRQQLRAKRRALSAPQQQQAARDAATFLPELPHWPHYRHIAIYLANDGELDTGPVAENCRKAGGQLYLPAVDTGNGQLQFRPWNQADTLISNRYGIDEPAPDTGQMAPEKLDLVFLPLVGWDSAGNRLGMGGGYYDRSLAGIAKASQSQRPLLVGLAHHLQQIDQLPSEHWDIRLDYVLTNKGLLRCE